MNHSVQEMTLYSGLACCFFCIVYSPVKCPPMPFKTISFKELNFSTGQKMMSFYFYSMIRYVVYTLIKVIVVWRKTECRSFMIFFWVNFTNYWPPNDTHCTTLAVSNFQLNFGIIIPLAFQSKNHKILSA